MTLREARCAFSLALAELVLWAHERGYEVAFDDVKARDGHRPKSLHYLGLAADLNLYVGGQWQPRSEQHMPLGEHWELKGKEKGLPLAWGGRFESPDGNHYSLAWEGRK